MDFHYVDGVGMVPKEETWMGPDEQPMDMAVELSKTAWAAHCRLSSEMRNLGREMLAALPCWMRRLLRRW